MLYMYISQGQRRRQPIAAQERCYLAYIIHGCKYGVLRGGLHCVRLLVPDAAYPVHITLDEENTELLMKCRLQINEDALYVWHSLIMHY